MSTRIEIQYTIGGRLSTDAAAALAPFLTDHWSVDDVYSPFRSEEEVLDYIQTHDGEEPMTLTTDLYDESSHLQERLQDLGLTYQAVYESAETLSQWLEFWAPGMEKAAEWDLDGYGNLMVNFTKLQERLRQAESAEEVLAELEARAPGAVPPLHLVRAREGPRR